MANDYPQWINDRPEMAQNLSLLWGGVAAWNDWRTQNRERRSRIDLCGAEVGPMHLAGADLREVNLSRACLAGANLNYADLYEADLEGANLAGANLKGAILARANLRQAKLYEAKLYEANLEGANLRQANLEGANLRQASLIETELYKADLRGANLIEVNLRQANLEGANLEGANLGGANLIRADLTNTNLTGCRVYGISAWDLKLERAKQRDLVITTRDQPEITVDNLQVAQFIYLLLNNEKIRDIIDTIGKKGVLLLGRFTGELKDKSSRMVLLERLREELRRRGYVPIVFNFERPEKSDFTETIMTLAGLCRFVIADITNPRSTPLELQATVPAYMIPFVPIIEDGEEPFAMFQDLQGKYSDWVLDTIIYGSLEELVRGLDKYIIEPARVRFDELLVKKTEKRRIRRIGT